MDIRLGRPCCLKRKPTKQMVLSYRVSCNIRIARVQVQIDLQKLDVDLYIPIFQLFIHKFDTCFVGQYQFCSACFDTARLLALDRFLAHVQFKRPCDSLNHSFLFHLAWIPPLLRLERNGTERKEVCVAKVRVIGFLVERGPGCKGKWRR